MVSFLCFLFETYIPEAGNSELPVLAKRKSLSKSPFCLAKGPGKGQALKTEHFEAIITLLQLNITDKNVTLPQGPSANTK